VHPAFVFVVLAACSSDPDGDPSDDTATPTDDTAPTDTTPTDTTPTDTTPTDTGEGPSLDSTFAVDGFGESGPWRGHLYTLAEGPGSVVSPECNEEGTAPCFDNAGPELCVGGAVALSYGARIELGWYLDQAAEPPNPPGTWALEGSGVAVDVHRVEPSTPLRVALYSDTGGYWCAELPASGKGVIPWTSFVPECYPGGMDKTPVPPGTPIERLVLQVVGSEVVRRTGEFCWIDARLSTR